VVVSTPHTRERAPGDAAACSPHVVWHDLECGAYAADLPLWRELAVQARHDHGSAPILEIGAGTGRVALELMRAGHRVTALDLDEQLLTALRRRARGGLEAVCADARTFELSRRDFSLCIAPMQTVQLLAGARERMAFMARAHAHLRPGGVLALAIVGALEQFDCNAGDPEPAAEVRRIGDRLYVSRAVRVQVRTRSIVIERERRIVAQDGSPASLERERDVLKLSRVTPAQLEREGVRAGLSPAPARLVPGTGEHVGSAVVMLRA
jgi:SAM-dependent methyltransferase